MAIVWPAEMCPILGGRAAIARERMRPCRCGEEVFVIVEHGDGSISVQCSKCRPPRPGEKACGTISMVS
jgi:hypothetical protein